MKMPDFPDPPGDMASSFRAVGMNFHEWKRVTRALRDQASDKDRMAESPHTMTDESRRSFRTMATSLRNLADKIERQL